MTQDELQGLFIETLGTYFADVIGEVEIEPETDPIMDLGLDSLHGIEFAMELTTELTWSIPDDVNPLVDDEKKCSLTVEKACARLLRLKAAAEADQEATR